MVALISFFVILIFSLTIVRVASVMLELTGISADSARFQARSAFTGAGYTTRESEMIVTHPVRRKIIGSLMLIGNIGFVTFVSSLVISFLSIRTRENALITFGVFFGGLLLLYLIARSKMVNRMLQKIIERLLKKWTKIYTHDYDSLLNLSGNFEVVTVPVKHDSWLSDSSLADLKLSDEGVLVLGIRRSDGYFLGSPRGETAIYPRDELICYGREDALKNLIERGKGSEGNLQHQLAVEHQQRLEGRQVKKGGKGVKNAAGRLSKGSSPFDGLFGKKR